MIHVWLRMMWVLGLICVAAGCGDKKAEPAALPEGRSTNALPDFTECRNKPEIEQRRCRDKVHKKRIDYLANPPAQGLPEMERSSGDVQEEGCGTLPCADLEQFIARLGRMKGRHGKCEGEMKDDVLFFLEKDKRHFSDTYVAPESSVGWQARNELSSALFRCDFLREDIEESAGPLDLLPESSKVITIDKIKYCAVDIRWSFKSGEVDYSSAILKADGEEPRIDAVREHEVDRNRLVAKFIYIWAYSGGSPYWDVASPISGFRHQSMNSLRLEVLENASRLEATRKLIDSYISLSLRDYKSYKPGPCSRI